MPNLELNVIVPVVNAIIGSHATLICSGNYDHEYCAFTSPTALVKLTISVQEMTHMKMAELKGLVPLLKNVVCKLPKLFLMIVLSGTAMSKQ